MAPSSPAIQHLSPTSSDSLPLGAHQSIAGGTPLAVERGVSAGCRALQIFVKNNSRWIGKEIGSEEAGTFRRAVQVSPLAHVVAHTSYLPNLASPVRELRRLSILALVDEVLRCKSLGIRELVHHPGSHGGEGEAAGVARIAGSLDEVFRRTEGAPVRILLETAAGQGTAVGYRFEHLRDIVGAVRERSRVAVCFDTCHVHAAGYDLTSKEGYAATIEDFRRTVGLSLLRAIHVNDSKKPRGARVDRHEHIGQGAIGEAGFANLMSDPRLARIPKFLETPKERPRPRPGQPCGAPPARESDMRIRAEAPTTPPVPRRGGAPDGSRVTRLPPLPDLLHAPATPFDHSAPPAAVAQYRLLVGCRRRSARRFCSLDLRTARSSPRDQSPPRDIRVASRPQGAARRRLGHADARRISCGLPDCRRPGTRPISRHSRSQDSGGERLAEAQPLKAGLLWILSLACCPLVAWPLLAHPSYRRFSLACRLGLAAAVGGVLLSGWMTLFALAGISWRLIPLVALAAATAFLLRFAVKSESDLVLPPASEDPAGLFETLAFAVAAAAVLVALARRRRRRPRLPT